jgi:translocation and assembly module TamB
MRSWLRRKRFWAAVALVALSVALTLWVLLSESAARLALGRLRVLTLGRVACERPTGTLAGPFGCDRLVVTGARWSVTAERLVLAPRWSALWRGEVAADALRAARADFAYTPSNEPPQPPRTLAPPIALRVDALDLPLLTIRGPGAPYALHDVRARLVAGRSEHDLALSLRSPWADLAGEAKLGAEPPYEIRGELRASRADAPSGAVRAQLSGSLIELAAALEGTLAGAPLRGEAELASFADARVRRATLRAERVDLAAFFAKAPHSEANLALDLALTPDRGLAGELRVENASPGTLAERALPLRTLHATLRHVTQRSLRVDTLEAALAPRGALRGNGKLADRTLTLRLEAEDVDLRALDARLIETRLAGAIEGRVAAREQRARLDLRDPRARLSGLLAHADGHASASDLHIAAARGGELAGEASVDLGDAQRFSARLRFARFDPARFGDFPSARLSGELDAEGALGADWSASLRAQLAGSQFRGRALEGGGTLELAAAKRWQADVALALGANRATLRGQFGEPGDALVLSLDAGDLSALGPPFAGRAQARGELRGTRARPSGSLALEASGLRLPSEIALDALDARASLGDAPARPLELALHAGGFRRGRAVLDGVEVRVAGPLAAHTISIATKGPEVDAQAELAGGFDARWSGRLVAFENRTEPALRLLEPATLDADLGFFELGPARIGIYQGELAIGSLRYARGALSSAGAAHGIQASALLAAAGRPADPGSDLTLRGVWIVPESPDEPGTVHVEREAGDLAFGGVELALAELAVDAAIEAEHAALSGRLRSNALGDADLRGTLDAPRGATVLAGDTRIDGAVSARLPSLAPIGGLLDLAALVAGSAELDLSLGGTLRKPLVTGRLASDELRLDLPQSGIALRDGRVRARFVPDAIAIDELEFRGTKGKLRASGELALGDAPSQLAWRAQKLRLLNRPDRQLSVSGEGTLRLQDGRAALHGALRIDHGQLELPRQQTHLLGDDVVIAGRERPPASRLDPSLLDLDLEIDAGERLDVSGIGVEARLGGKLRVRSLGDGRLAARGKIDATNGIYRAFGQRLEIERGALVFDGPADDPALDVVAYRRNLAVEAGIELTGTVKLPMARLISRPPVPDSEKLAWLVLGHGVADASAADLGLLETAASTLLSGAQSTPISQRIARGIGLDDLAIRGTSSDASSQAVALGKRITDDLYVEYEYGLALAQHLVRLQYALSRAFSIRAETTGETSSFGVNFRRSWD